MSDYHVTKWTDEAIISGISKVKAWLKIDRMPTRQECIHFYKNSQLSNAVSRRPGGWAQLACELGLPMKESDTGFGKEIEQFAAQMLENNGYHVTRMSQNFAYDLLIEDLVKIDVKASRLYQGPQGAFYSFGITKNYMTCDFYLLFCLNENKELQKYYLIPSVDVFDKKQISIGENRSKYDCYKDTLCDLPDYIAFLAGKRKLSKEGLTHG